MHKALREVLGDTCSRRVAGRSDKTRFDFAHTQPMTAEEIRAGREHRQCREILANAATTPRDGARGSAEVGRDDAVRREVRRRGARARRSARRRSCAAAPTCTAPATSACSRSSEGRVSPPASAVSRRSPATTRHCPTPGQERRVQGMSALLKVQPTRSPTASPPASSTTFKALEKELARLKSKLAASQGDELVRQRSTSKASRCSPPARRGADAPTLRETMDKLKDKLKRPRSCWQPRSPTARSA